jgi:hypothetical protein
MAQLINNMLTFEFIGFLKYKLARFFRAAEKVSNHLQSSLFFSAEKAR